MNESRAIVIRGSRIFEDVNGHICLDDLWRAAKAKETRSPAKWRISRMAKALIIELEKKIKISSLKEDKAVAPSIYARRGRGSTGTFAHPILAAAYAGYLSPKLELEVREIWLRYRPVMPPWRMKFSSELPPKKTAGRALVRSPEASESLTPTHSRLTM